MKRTAAKGTAAKTAEPDGRAGVEAWLKGVAPEQRRLASKLDKIILGSIPGAACAIKYRKPSQPLGVPFYGRPARGWIVFVNALKGRMRLTFFAGGGLAPVPPIRAPGGARAIDIASDEELDERQVRGWLRQAKGLDGWGHV